MENKEWDMTGKVCLITGANAGIGKRAALQLSELGAEVIIVCRNLESGHTTANEIIAKAQNNKVHVMQGDLSSQASIHSLADSLKSKWDKLDVLIHNAANFDLTMKKPTITGDGVETIFATNHIGPFLLTNLLLDLLIKGKGRIITIASKGLLAYPRLSIEFDNLHGERTFSPTHAYYHSKLAQLMFTYYGSELLSEKGITLNAIRVPSVKVDEGRHENVSFLLRKAYSIKRKFSISPEKMAETYTYLAASPELNGVTGKYFDETNSMITSSKRSYDREVWESLWLKSNELAKIVHW